MAVICPDAARIQRFVQRLLPFCPGGAGRTAAHRLDQQIG